MIFPLGVVIWNAEMPDMQHLFPPFLNQTHAQTLLVGEGGFCRPSANALVRSDCRRSRPPPKGWKHAAKCACTSRMLAADFSCTAACQPFARLMFRSLRGHSWLKFCLVQSGLVSSPGFGLPPPDLALGHEIRGAEFGLGGSMQTVRAALPASPV